MGFKDKAEEVIDKINNKVVKDQSLEVEPNFFTAEKQRCLLLREMAEERVRTWEEKKVAELKQKHDEEMQGLYKQITKAISDLQETQRNEILLAKNSIDPKYIAIIQDCNNFLLKLDKMEENNATIHNKEN